MRKNKNFTNPLVSVLMPVYNAEQFLPAAIESILSQTYKDIELLVVIDASPDRSLEVAQAYARRDSRVKVINLKKNRGDCGASNEGFKKSRGEFLVRMDSDDVAVADRIEKQVAYMLAHPRTIVVGGQADVIDENNLVTGKKTFPQSHKDIYKAYGTYHPMLHPACMFRRSLLPNKDFLYREGFKPNDDYRTLFELLKYGQFHNLADTIMQYRIHSTNISLKNPRRLVFNALRIRKVAVTQLGYKMSLYAYLVNLAQLIFATLMPEKLIVPAYMIFRGMTSLSTLVEKAKSSSPVASIREAIATSTRG